jgi:hypothetical protein
MITMRRLVPLALGLFTVPALGAQSIFDSELRFAPQFVQYQIKAPGNETISELALPVFVSIPFGSQFTFDVGTSYSRARVTNGAAKSEINGLTDTQLHDRHGFRGAHGWSQPADRALIGDDGPADGRRPHRQ